MDEDMVNHNYDCECVLCACVVRGLLCVCLRITTFAVYCVTLFPSTACFLNKAIIMTIGG